MTETAPDFQVHIIAGPNGAGKTTFAKAFLPQVGIREFLNADLIAAGLTPLHPEASAFKAGKILLLRWKDLATKRQSFAFETTLSGRAYLKRIDELRAMGPCQVHIHYLWLPSVSMCLQRIRNRVKKGGHHVPTVDVRRRHPQSIRNFFNRYIPKADKAWLWDVSEKPPSMVASWVGNEVYIEHVQKYERICASLSVD